MTARRRKPLPWRVVRQHIGKLADVRQPDAWLTDPPILTTPPDSEVCRHRWEWTAELCAHRRTVRGHRTEVGVHYAARPGAAA